MSTSTGLADGQLFRFDVRSVPPSLCIALHGELDVSGQDLTWLITDANLLDIRQVLVDLGGLEFIDGFGVRTVAALCHAGTAREVPVLLGGAPPLVRRVFTAAGQAQLLAD